MTDANQVFPTNHLDGTSKSILTATKLQHKNLNNNYKNTNMHRTKLNLKLGMH